MEKPKYRKVRVDDETMERLKAIGLLTDKSVDDVAADLISKFMKSQAAAE